MIKRHHNYVNYVVALSLLFTLKKFYSLFAPYSGASIVELEQKKNAGFGFLFLFFSYERKYFLM